MSKKNIRRNYAATGFSLLEILLVIAVGLVITAIAIPVARTAIATYQLLAAVDTAEGAIQSPRYQAIMRGYPYQVDFNSATNKIQISSEIPPAVTFSAVGSATPVSASAVTLGVGTANAGNTGHLILQLKPNGAITISSGQASPAALSISYNGTTKHLTVSNYGSISVATTTP